MPEYRSPTLRVIAAGPLYLEFRTEPISPPAPVYHTLATLKETDPGEYRRLGGSAWHFALYWARELSGNCDDRVHFVGKRPVYDGPIDGSKGLLHDAQWLHEEARQRAGEADRLILHLSAAEGVRRCDYTYHFPTRADPADASARREKRTSDQPDWRPSLWPILTIKGGASEALTWNDVIGACQQKEGSPEEGAEEMIFFLGGVQRTSLLEGRAERPKGAKLVIDFGRTDLRHATKKDKRVMWRCIKDADTVLVDADTAEVLDLLTPENLPKDYLVVRPHGVLPGMWRFFRRHPKKPECIEWYDYSTQELDKAHQDEAREEDGVQRRFGRPERVARLVHQLYHGRDKGRCHWGPLRKELEATGKVSDWKSYYSVSKPRTIQDVTNSAQLKRELEDLEERVREYQRTRLLLIYGETGTGKEVIARWLSHVHPTRPAKIFIPVSCGRLRGELVDSELFGHVAGAFTGATDRKPGAFQAADGGFLLIDDLDALPLSTQAKLLRVIEEDFVRPVGAPNVPLPVDVFTIFTTNRAPERLVAEEKLRKDLYYRLLRGAFLRVPPLRERRCDAIRAAKQCWEDLNHPLPTKERRSWPKEYQRVLRTSPIDGNYRIVEAATACVHRELRRNASGATREPGFILPKQAAIWLGLDPLVHDDDHGESPAEGFRKWLEEQGIPPDRLLKGHEACRLEAFLEVWPRWQNDGGPGVLSRKHLQAILDIKNRLRMLKVLREDERSGRTPRVRRVGVGRGSMWTLFSDPTVAAAP